jgi:hypothetical protein
MLELTAEDVLKTQTFRRAVKTAPVKIRPITQEDVARIGPSFFDLESRPQRVEVGRYLCAGINNEQWTCSEQSMQQRTPISEPDDDGFRLYVQRYPQPVLVTLIDEPFCLTLASDRWSSQAGAITWNGQRGDGLIMRVVEKNIFLHTYQFLDEL